MNVVTMGVFDLMHEGHTNLFRRCWQSTGGNGRLHIGVNTERFVLEYKGITPHDSELTRMENVSKWGRAFLHDGDTMKDLSAIESLRCIVVGSDWAERPYLLQIGVTQQWLDDRGIAVMYVPYTKGISSTQLRAERA